MFDIGEVVSALLFWAVIICGFVYVVRRGRKYRGSPNRKPLARSMSSLNKLEKLQALRDSGALTEAEFEAEKAKVLR
jgi:hypothetical protein